MLTRSKFLYSTILVITSEVMICCGLSISENQTVSVGDTVTIVCTTQLFETVEWKHRGVGKTNAVYVYRLERLEDEYEARFEFKQRDDRSYALVINGVQKSDAGNYMCIEDDGVGENTTSEIVTIEFAPNCSSNISTCNMAVGENSCGIAPDYIGLICSLNYVGNIAPTLEWHFTATGDVSTTGAQVSTSSSLTTSTLSVPASSATDTSKYSCRVKMLHPQSYTCKPEPNNVMSGGMTSGMTIVFVCIGGFAVLIIVVVVVIIVKKRITQQPADDPESTKMETVKASTESNQNNQPNEIGLGRNGPEIPVNGHQPPNVTNHVVIEDSREVCLPDNSNLIGIDWLENKIYALSFNLKCVFVFSDVAPYQEFKDERISLKNTDQVDDIVCCRTCRALFVSDYSEKKLVFKIDILTKDVRFWAMGGKPSKLSTTASGNLLVIVRGLKINKAFLEIYESTDMSKLRTVEFPGDTARPIKATKNSRGQLILLYRNQLGEDVIAEINLNESSGSSSVVRSFNLSSQRADKSRQLSHLVIGRDDTMYIADDGNMKLLCVDNLFHSCTVFRQFQVGGMPYRLCYVRESGKLIAGQWNPGLFQIFGNA